MIEYDFNSVDLLVVGGGPAGVTAAVRYADLNPDREVVIFDERDLIGGASATEVVNGITVHKYGPHILHTDNEEVWDFLNLFCDLVPFINSPIANYHGELYNLPFNMNTFIKVFGDEYCTESRVIEKISEEIKEYAKFHPEFSWIDPKNLEEKAISLVGTTIYRKLIKEYTEKQWGKDCSELPESYITRLPLRFTFDNNYYSDEYQGIPRGGYSKMFSHMIVSHSNITYVSNSKVTLMDLQNAQKQNSNLKIIYTGALDRLLDFRFGNLPYRTLEFKTIKMPQSSFQGNAVMNFTSHDEKYTRIVEHKFFDRSCRNDSETIITFEYPASTGFPYYPINNSDLYTKYLNCLRKKLKNFTPLGRAGEWKYYDMDDVILKALEVAENLNSSEI